MPSVHAHRFRGMSHAVQLPHIVHPRSRLAGDKQCAPDNNTTRSIPEFTIATINPVNKILKNAVTPSTEHQKKLCTNHTNDEKIFLVWITKKSETIRVHYGYGDILRIYKIHCKGRARIALTREHFSGEYRASSPAQNTCQQECAMARLTSNRDNEPYKRNLIENRQVVLHGNSYSQ